jgi:membrane-associated phospholipid phosphatase
MTISKPIPWARIISDLFSPPVIWGVLAFPIAYRAAGAPEQALLWGLTYTVIVCVLPALYISFMVWRGHITDIHMEVREQRIRPFLVSIICAALAWVVLRYFGAPSLLPTFTLFSLIQIAVMLGITLVWQISMHAMSIACAVVAMGVLYGVVPGLLLSPLIPVVGAARLKLHRHTPSQVVAGALLGAGMTAAFALMIGMQGGL